MLEPQSQNKRTADFLRDLLYISKRNDSAILLDVGLIQSSSVSSLALDVPDYTGHGGFSFNQDMKKTVDSPVI
ncbi:hypothetical protein BGZ60DRAFT_89814 [Tricladium varicosporioides]|nr:hypothetical protein BGZ60DRAFT_89814 [Hymenoscyphus varicosporioides]